MQLFLVYIAVLFELFFIYLENNKDTHDMRTMIIKMIKFYKGRSNCQFLEKKKSCVSLFDEVDILGLSEIVLLCVAFI